MADKLPKIQDGRHDLAVFGQNYSHNLHQIDEMSYKLQQTLDPRFTVPFGKGKMYGITNCTVNLNNLTI